MAEFAAARQEHERGALVELQCDVDGTYRDGISKRPCKAPGLIPAVDQSSRDSVNQFLRYGNHVEVGSKISKGILDRLRRVVEPREDGAGSVRRWWRCRRRR